MSGKCRDPGFQEPYQRTWSLARFNLYSYFENFFYTLLFFFPHPFRILVLKLRFKRLGHHAFIDHGCYFRYPHQISIGDYVSINRGCSIFGSYYSRDTTVTIGNNVVIAPEVKIFTASHDYHDINLPDYGKGISIGDHAWIGGGAILLPGVTIGTGAVIGAGSVVTRDIPDWTVAAGNPARIIKKRILNQKITDSSNPEISSDPDKGDRDSATE